jgi:hypothetical protein
MKRITLLKTSLAASIGVSLLMSMAGCVVHDDHYHDRTPVVDVHVDHPDDHHDDHYDH